MGAGCRASRGGTASPQSGPISAHGSRGMEGLQYCSKYIFMWQFYFSISHSRNKVGSAGMTIDRALKTENEKKKLANT
jgi:hypothetical protein